MKILSKRGLVRIVIVVVCSLLIIATMRVLCSKINENKRKKIMMTYVEQNYAFDMAGGYPFSFEIEGVYQSIPIMDPEYNRFGIDVYKYLFLKMYEIQTRKTLTYEEIVDYCSQEYEDNGSLRLYNNGLHPEIESYVIWAQGRQREMLKYASKIRGIYSEYASDNKNNGFIRGIFYTLSPQMLDELAKKEADPDYELDLLGLQQQGY